MSLLIKNDDNRYRYDVYVKRDGKKVKFNKKPLTINEAKNLESDIRRSKISNVDLNSIEYIQIII